jgi:DnaJ-class molecular chaperone
VKSLGLAMLVTVPGDLFVRIHARRYPLFARDPNDVLCEVAAK